VLTPLAGAVVKRAGIRRALWGALTLAAAGLPLMLAPHLAVVLTGMVLVGVGTFFAQAVATGFVGRAATGDRGSASGIYLACYFLGGLAGQRRARPGLRRLWLGCLRHRHRRRPPCSGPPGDAARRAFLANSRDTPMTVIFDALVIGSGQAGPSLAVRLADSDLRTALIERERFGGTCVNNGCIPTKTLIASARTASVVRRAADYGVSTCGPSRST
jgi:hypothetical protein